MATLLNTLLASLFPALLGAQQENLPVQESSAEAEIIVKSECEINCNIDVYFYQSV